jgi:hypothetical protein
VWERIEPPSPSLAWQWGTKGEEEAEEEEEGEEGEEGERGKEGEEGEMVACNRDQCVDAACYGIHPLAAIQHHGSVGVAPPAHVTDAIVDCHVNSLGGGMR